MRQIDAKKYSLIAFFLLWVFSFVFIRTIHAVFLLDPAQFLVTSVILLTYLAIPIFFICLLAGSVLGAIAGFSTIFALFVFFDKTIYLIPIVSVLVAGSVGCRTKIIFEKVGSHSTLEAEHVNEELNLINAAIKAEENSNTRIRVSLQRTAHLKEMIEDYSRVLSEKEILDSIIENSFKLFEDSGRVLLYLVDTEAQELMLVRSRKSEERGTVKAKKGDVFDKWVLKQKKPLFVENVRKDFRFSAEEEQDENFSSIISVPITDKDTVLGIVRIDSPEKGKFTQSDLRFLDIIGDFSSIALQNAILYTKVSDLAVHDSLTELYVHKYFIEKLADGAAKFLKGGVNFSLIMLDLDNFKEYNDRYGHTAGDLALKRVAAVLKSYTSSADVVARYGGEEFVLLVLNRSEDYVIELAENIRKAVSEKPIVLRRQKMGITVSLGVAHFPSEKKTEREILQLVDERLYRAKKTGKNRVCSK